MFSDPIAEWKLLGGFVKDNGGDYLSRATEYLFTDDRQWVWNKIKETYTMYGTVTLDGLINVMKGEVPGELLAVPDNIDVAAVFDNCVRLANKRRYKDLSEQFKLYSETYDPSVDKIQQLIEDVSVVQEYDSSIKSAASPFLEEINAKRLGKYRFVDTGLPFMNARLGGEWPPRTYILIAADAGGGKTSAVANSIIRMVYDFENNKVKDNPNIPLFYSLEMSKKHLFLKWAADLCNIDSKDINAGRISEKDMRRIDKVVQLLQQLPIYVVEEGDITFYQMAKLTRDHVKKYNARVVFVDYLQIINHHPTGNDVIDLGDVAFRQRELSKDLNICHVNLSQVNRGKEGLDAIHGSSIPGKHADAVFILTAQEEDARLRTVEVNAVKNRLGPTGRSFVQFEGPFQRFIGSKSEDLL